MKRNIDKILLSMMAMVIAMAMGGCSSSRKALTGGAQNTRKNIVGALGVDYPAWTQCRISGKLKAPGLPISPSLQIYMKKGVELQISARAPFVGEAFRVELNGDSLLMVNKLKKTYCRESADKLAEIYPTAPYEIQSLLLGRMVVPGSGELSRENADRIKVGNADDGNLKVEPQLGDLPGGVKLYYIVNSDGKLLKMLIDNTVKTIFSLNYDWKNNGNYDINAYTTKKGKPYEVELQLDKPDYSGSPLSPVSITSKYTRQTIKEFLGKLL